MANATALPCADVPPADFAAFRTCVLENVAAGAGLAALCPFRRGNETHLVAVLDNPASAGLAVARTGIVGYFPSLTPDCPQAQGSEREIAEGWGIVPVGHPWLKPLRFHRLPNGERDPVLS